MTSTVFRNQEMVNTAGNASGGVQVRVTVDPTYTVFIEQGSSDCETVTSLSISSVGEMGEVRAVG